MTDIGQAAACPNDSSSASLQNASVSLPLFPLGQVLATPGVLELLETYQLPPLSFIQRHVVGDWGDICAEDQQVNADALQYGYRLMSVYAITPTEKLWVITEADRSCTTLLLPEEY
ncbi:type I restriction endonuclease subunit M [Comamonas aquatica]|nr:type I restriction endonuclease subunit M [Comamonas aquatica]MDH0382366.1 type I restriction endonuclease subunit M [Comamonas aquatica]MDH0430511.1 type I restriction endonuclease subunit M [Comamonas aquatica]MDH0941445.1 type I restriction endonuclease subunit M [Comamonas aquatica]